MIAIKFQQEVKRFFFFDAFRYVGTQAVVRVPFSWLVENVKLHRSTRPISSCVANYLLPPSPPVFYRWKVPLVMTS